ncbi:reticulon-1-like [Centruroides vittatus]|uniref:reticulon-1-like n=1 Tax=Centruroides vittatus TaxID=120091 RepID=UPI0035108FE7
MQRNVQTRQKEVNRQAALCVTRQHKQSDMLEMENSILKMQLEHQKLSIDERKSAKHKSETVEKSIITEIELEKQEQENLVKINNQLQLENEELKETIKKLKINSCKKQYELNKSIEMHTVHIKGIVFEKEELQKEAKSKLDKRLALENKLKDLVYWKDPYKTGIVFGTGLVLLLSLTYYSIISVVAYVFLIGLMMGIGLKILKNCSCLTQFGEYPFEIFFNTDIILSSDQIHQYVDILLEYANEVSKNLRRLFLIESVVDSFKLGLMLFCMTYIGSYFNGMTLIIMAYVSFFTVPKLYETYHQFVCRKFANPYRQSIYTI